MTTYKVLTLHQPWATLIALGVKTIETRSWSTSYRGPLAIHAAARKPSGLDGLAGMIGRFTAHQDAQSDGWYLLDSDWAARDYGAYQLPIALPLGFIVATCVLADVVPMTTHAHTGDPECVVVHGDGSLDHCIPSYPPPPGPPNIIHLDEPDIPDGTMLICDISDQLPYGDFRPGRYGWILTDIAALDEPIPFKGGQGLTKTWEPG